MGFPGWLIACNRILWTMMNVGILASPWMAAPATGGLMLMWLVDDDDTPFFQIFPLDGLRATRGFAGGDGFKYTFQGGRERLQGFEKCKFQLMKRWPMFQLMKRWRFFSMASQYSMKMMNAGIPASPWMAAPATGGLMLMWVTFVIAFLLLLTGSALNDQKGMQKMYLGDYCYVLKPGVFSGGAFLSLASVSLRIIYYLALQKPKSSQPWDPPHNQGIALGQPHIPPRTENPVFVHEDTYKFCNKILSLQKIKTISL